MKEHPKLRSRPMYPKVAQSFAILAVETLKSKAPLVSGNPHFELLGKAFGATFPKLTSIFKKDP